MSRQAAVASRFTRDSFVGKLAKFFPDVTPVRIPVRVSGSNAHGALFDESTVIEFGTPNEVLFASTLPLEFGDKLRLQNSDGSLDAEASIVAVQYYSGQKAVAVRFARPITNWIIKR